MAKRTTSANVRSWTENDAALLKSLATECQPLLVNGVYVNIFLAKYFGNSCFILEIDKQPIGFISGLKGTVDPKVFFLWQMGLAQNQRGKGYSTVLIERIFEAARDLKCKKVQFSIAPTIDSSFHAISRFAARNRLNMSIIEEKKYSDPLTGKQGHEVFYEIKI